MKTCKRNLHEYEGKFCKECRKIWKNDTKEKNKAKTLVWRLRNKEKLLAKKKQYMLKNREAILVQKRKHYQENKEEAKKYQKIHQREKSKTCVRFKLLKNLRGRLSHIIKGKTKTGSAVHDLGCSGEELRRHLESLFQSGMSWDNYGNKDGNWSIDHIIPLSRVDIEDREQFLKVNHYSNLQPLWHVDNMCKGNKLCS